MKKYIVKLSQQQRQQLQGLIGAGHTSARSLTHARLLLKADQGEQGPGWSDEQISEALEVSVPTIERVRHRFVDHGLQDAVDRRPQPPRPEKRILNGKHEAHLIALSCSQKPEGWTRWSVRLLADRMVELGEVEQVSRETIRRTLKKTNSNPG